MIEIFWQEFSLRVKLAQIDRCNIWRGAWLEGENFDWFIFQDVIESYSAGHTDLVFKVKGIQTRLDQILGAQGSKAKDVYDSKTSLASKIVNIERQVDSIDEKLQVFIEMYQKDRERFDKEILCKSESPKVESISDTTSSRPYHAMLNCSQETVIEKFIDTSTEASSPESEVNLPTDSLSNCSTVTSVNHGLESDVKISNTNSIFKNENAFKVWVYQEKIRLNQTSFTLYSMAQRMRRIWVG